MTSDILVNVGDKSLRILIVDIKRFRGKLANGNDSLSMSL